MESPANQCEVATELSLIMVNAALPTVSASLVAMENRSHASFDFSIQQNSISTGFSGWVVNEKL